MPSGVRGQRLGTIQRKEVVAHHRDGKNYRLILECGHVKVLGSSRQMPRKAYCPECPAVPQ